MTNTERQEFEALRKIAQDATRRAEFAEKALEEWKAGNIKEKQATETLAVIAAERDAARSLARDLASVVRCYDQGVPLPQAALSRIASNKAAVIG